MYVAMYRGTLLAALCVLVNAQFEGEPCVDDGVLGVCTNINKCQSTRNTLKNKRPKLCSYDRNDAIICCFDNISTTAAVPVATTSKPVSTTEDDYYEPPPEDYQVKPGSSLSCGPVDANLTAARTGQIAWDKCLEYQEKLVYPCEESVSLRFGAPMERKNKCHINADDLIVNGDKADRNEFTHMVLLGFGQNPGIKWECAGSLISEKFVLTAAHCVTSADWGNVTYASIGVLTRSEVSATNTYAIAERIRHPDYRRRVYNDIALLRLEKEVPLGEYTVPACLYVGDPVKDGRASATGWGLLQDRGDIADILQKVTLKKVRPRICKKEYPQHSLISHNYDETTQLCYGSNNKTHLGDTCQGDSGGPLQIKHNRIICMYNVLGVTSGGRGCAIRGKPGLYSRVSYYVSWIESVVWPEEYLKQKT